MLKPRKVRSDPSNQPQQRRVTVKQVFRLIALIILAGSFGLIWAQQDQPAEAQKPADNTKVNQRDREKTEPTADQQKENKSDRELARQVRRALVKDKSLSTYAHNVKVIAQDGMVTLKGPVHSDQEKQAVEAKAAEAAGGSDKVKSEIEVSSKNGGEKPSANKTDQQ
jgi:hyperosmotically inducible periplasmic protein